MTWLYLIILLALMWVSVCVRLTVLHPFGVVVNTVRDLWNWFIHKEWRVYHGGKLNCYSAHFGGGKTLSMVHQSVFRDFKKYNNKMVWDRGRKKWVLQKVEILSNVHLSDVPYIYLTSLSQIVNRAMVNKKLDEENDTRTVTIVDLDEASSQLNSRNFKTNIDASFLNTLITSRHYHISFYYTAQKFKLVDALMRSVTQNVVNCKKVWRFMVQEVYDADEVEYASDPTMIKPKRRTGFFIRNRDYNAYDTLACVEKLKKSVDNGDMLSAEEILALRGDVNPDNDAISHRSRKLKRRQKK